MVIHVSIRSHLCMARSILLIHEDVTTTKMILFLLHITSTKLYLFFKNFLYQVNLLFVKIYKHPCLMGLLR
jgi:hypothetical protein